MLTTTSLNNQLQAEMDAAEELERGDCSAGSARVPRCTPAAPSTAGDKEQQQKAWGRAWQKLENVKREPARKLSNALNLKAAHVQNVKSIHKYYCKWSLSAPRKGTRAGTRTQFFFEDTASMWSIYIEKYTVIS